MSSTGVQPSLSPAVALSAWRGPASTPAAKNGGNKQAPMQVGLPREPLEGEARLSRPLIWDIKAAHNLDYSAVIAAHHLPAAWSMPFLLTYVLSICWGKQPVRRRLLCVTFTL